MSIFTYLLDDGYIVTSVQKDACSLYSASGAAMIEE